jgi:hypothetical protein
MQFQRVSVSAKGLQQCQNVEARACNKLALMTLDWTQGELTEGLRYYRSQKFFAAHEHWESVWLATKRAREAIFASVDSTGSASPPLPAGELARRCLIDADFTSSA